MKTRTFLVLVMALLAIAAAFFAQGCSTTEQPVQPVPASSIDELSAFDDATTKGDVQSTALAQYWGDRIVSEAFYALNQSRSGSSNVSYQGWVMGDWNYVESDVSADLRVSYWIGGCENRGGARGTVTMRESNGTYKVCHKGGYCRYFANLVLYRSSYGWGGGQHLVLPRAGTSYATQSVRNAQVGWVLQGSGGNLHTAIVVAVNGSGLDVVDANYVGGNGNFLIARHFYTWAKLQTLGYMAYCPWANPVLISQSGPTTQCF